MLGGLGPNTYVAWETNAEYSIDVVCMYIVLVDMVSQVYIAPTPFVCTRRPVYTHIYCLRTEFLLIPYTT